MSELDDMDGLGEMEGQAAEYVLGTLSRAERAEVARRRVDDRALDAAILAWERRLAPLNAAVKPVNPDPQLFERLREQIGLVRNVVSFKAREDKLRRSSRGWRNAAVGMGALAACLTGVIAYREVTKALMPTTYVAVLQADKASPAFVMTVDTQTKMFAVRALTSPAEQGKGYELWLVNDKLDKPMSLGMVEGKDMLVRPMEKGSVDRGLFMDATFAVSLEPEGGSPTGSPTGPVLFSGKLYQTTP